jgi:hypothetical protein
MLNWGASGRGRTNALRGSAAGASSWRLAWATLFVTAMAVCMVPMGCGSSDEYAVLPQQPMRPTKLPESTVRALQVCAEEGAGRLQRHAYEIGFKVEVTGDGAVRAVKPTGQRLHDDGLEGCIMDALRVMPARVIAENTLISHGAPVHAGSVLGSVAVLPELIELATVLATGSGVTIVVVVAVIVVVAAVSLTDRDPTEEECKELRKEARDFCLNLLAQPDPPREVIGPLMNLDECIASTLHEACGGKKVDREKSPRPGGRF